jgi:hypothetical protein
MRTDKLDPVAKSLYEARREASERTAASIARLERDGLFGDPHEDHKRLRLLDRRELRGWPAAGRGICSAIAGTQPGSDEHLERLG